jgi:hypothetical protein
LLAIPSILSAANEGSIKYHSFKGTHNSYDQPDGIARQLDVYNVWHVEIDLCGVSSGNRIEVKHGCVPGSPNGFLEDFLGELHNSSTRHDQIVFLWLDIKEQCLSLCNWRHHSDDSRAQLIAQAVEHVLGRSTIYAKDDWIADGMKWPFAEELLLRGKHYICIYDNNDHNPNHPLLFVSAHKPDIIFPHTAFLNIKDGQTGEFPGLSPMDDDRFLWRSYDLNTKEEWQSALNSGIQLLATDEYQASWAEVPDLDLRSKLAAIIVTVLQ